jgi:glycosyltransferase involved in cell wall biosynthesis
VKFRLIGQRNHLGPGTHFARFVDALRKLYFFDTLIEEVDVFKVAELTEAARSSTDSDVNIWFCIDSRIRHLKGTHIVWAIFEVERLPARFLDFLHDHADIVWVPSRWGCDILAANGIDRAIIDVIPEGVAAETFHPYLRGALDRAGQPFRFLMLGKYEERKSYPEVLDAFKQAFGNSDTVELVVKADYFLDFETKRKALEQRIEALGLRNIKPQWGNWATEHVAALYNCCDAFILPSRAEGWGLPLLEAAAAGMPVISTFYSGHTEFLALIETSLRKVDFTLEPIDDPEMHRAWPAEDGDIGRWAKPSIASLTRCMIEMKDNYAGFSAQARNNSIALRERFNWGAAADRALQALDRRNLLRLGYVVKFD